DTVGFIPANRALPARALRAGAEAACSGRARRGRQCTPGSAYRAGGTPVTGDDIDMVLGEEAQPTMTANSFDSRATLEAGGATHEIYRLAAVDGSDTLPYSLKVLLENLLRNEDGVNITADHISAVAGWDEKAEPSVEIQFTPARVILQDLTGVPAVVDLAAMREAMRALGGDPTKINPLIPAELVIDHSVVADAFAGFRVVPPGTGIVHQVNIEHLARVVMTHNGQAYPDTCVGTDSHTTME